MAMFRNLKVRVRAEKRSRRNQNHAKPWITNKDGQRLRAMIDILVTETSVGGNA
jgi:hypothetical protein